MLKLIQNEWMKLWHKKGTWFMVILLILAIIVPGAITKYYDTTDSGDLTWQQLEEESIKSHQEMLAQEEEFPEDKQIYEEQIALSEYRLDNNIAPTNGNNSIRGQISYGISLMMLITLFTVITAASIVSSEFSTGTIKMLLTRPVSRAKILTSKLLTVFIFGLFLFAVNMIISAITGVVLFGTSDGVALEFVDGQIVEAQTWGSLAYMALLSCGDFVMSTIFAFLIGSVFRSSSLAIGLTMALSFFGGLIVMFLSKYEIVKYIWITHSDLRQHETGFLVVDDITMALSLSVLAVYSVLFLVISYLSFMKRDVTA